MNNNLFLQPTLAEATLVDLLHKRALQQPRQIAYTFLVDGETEEVSLTYQALDQKARSLAAKLQSMKAIGERALLLYPPGLDFIIAFFGCLYAGVTAVPVYPPRRNQRMIRLQAIVKDAQASFALTTTSVLTNIEHSLKQEPDLAGLNYIATEKLNDNFGQNWQPLKITSDTLAFLQYTSGSTGTPKGVMVSHENLLHNQEMIKTAFQHTQETIFVGWLPLFHDMGLIGNVLQPLYLGMPSFLISPTAFLQKPLRWLMAISRYQATTSGGPNFAYDLCVDKITKEQRSQLDLSSWEVAFNGSEPVRAETIEKFSATFKDCGFRRSAFYPCYGMAEATLIVSGGLKIAPPVTKFVKEKALQQNLVEIAATEQKDTRAIVGVGKSWLDQKILIVNPESLTKCPDGQIGEIWVCGPSVAGGYWQRPQETQHTFNAQLQDTKEGPFLRTGDLGFLLDGELFFTGRIKDMIIIRGQNHYPQDIELTVHKSHPALRLNCGAAFSVQVEGIERLVIVQEIERSYLQKLDVDEVAKTICQAIFQQHELQVYAVVLVKPASIPKTSSGKIQRHACRDGFLNGSLDVVGDWTTNLQQIDSLQLQQEVEALWEEVQNSQESPADGESFSPAFTEEAIATWLVSHLALSLKVSPDEIDIQEPFATYGLDSAVAVSLTGELAQWLGCELEPTLFWEYPNIEVLAQYLAAEYQLLQSTTFPVAV
ncbi:AMP-binding protein [Nostoc sp. CENA67]|uniref:AMP-binding protein n=1 Tax=Amazonocrinis nigriterrae CENA67 TaxID=2794033 RepID=A0A8J7L927_9NOST|nr:AMP-binding protein [Amazonocrinis nigriterrae]MBH8563963.1 AMP-binding protein [Amazonocrinis nigriterrae CENA67]